MSLPLFLGEAHKFGEGKCLFKVTEQVCGRLGPMIYFLSSVQLTAAISDQVVQKESRFFFFFFFLFLATETQIKAQKVLHPELYVLV